MSKVDFPSYSQRHLSILTISSYSVKFIKIPDDASVGGPDVSLQEATIDMTIGLQIHVQT